MKKTLSIIALTLACVSATAQEEPKFTAKPSGRILMDATYINPQHGDDELNSGVGIPDMRVGVGFSYGQWKGKVDMGYAYSKVNLKDVWLQYDFDKKNFVRGGYFIHQYGFQSCTSSSFKETMEEPQSNAVFNNDQTGDQAAGAMTRLLYRSFAQRGKMLQVGISGGIEEARYSSDEALNHKQFTLATRWPTRVAKVNAQKAVVSDAKAMYKFSPEAM